MSTTYAKSQTTAQKKDAPSASSVLDASSQSESLQRKADMANNAAQRAEAPRPNNTGMPDNLKAGIESLSGFSMDNVRVHYNSSKPATVQALAYTQGTDIHVAPGQEKCLPHEAWHVAQQMAGRVSPTTNINGMPVNDNAALEHEADVMGEKAVQCKKNDDSNGSLKNEKKSDKVVQCEKVEPAGDDDIVSVGSEVADKPEHPHIAFETLAGGSRISELEGLYNNVIKAYEGKASVYMGVNVCKTNYKKIGNDIWTYGDKTPNDIVDELNPLKNEVKTTLQSPNAKDYHKITLIPFSWSLVGLKSAGVDIRLTQNQFGELKKGINPLLQSSVPSKGKKSTSDKGGPLVTVKKYENVENYNFPFYEARAYVMGKTVGNEADFYRWIDSDVRDDSSIEQINLMGYGAFGEKKDFLLAYLRNACCYIASTKSKKEYGEIVQEQNVIVLLNYLETKDRQSYGCFIRMCEKCEKESEKESGNLVYSGFYDWKQIDPVSKIRL